MTYLDQIVLLGTSLLGGVAGVLGSFAVLRRRALTGDLLSHAALPGLCLAFLVLGTAHFTGMLLGAFLTGLAGVGFMTLVCRWTRTKEDAAMGIVLSTFFGAGVVLLSVLQKPQVGGSRAGLESYIFGQAAVMSQRNLWTIAGVAVVALVVVMLLYKEFKVLSFDPGFARAQGWPTLTLDLTMMGTLALVTVIGLPAVGVVLMTAMLIIPAAAARFWTNRLGPMLLLSALIGALAGAIGTLLSSGVMKQWLGFDPLAFGEQTRGLPPGPVIVLSGTAIFLFSVFFAPQRGILSRALAGLRLQMKTARENLLRTLYELSEPLFPELPEITLDRLLARRAWSRGGARWLLWRAARAGTVHRGPAGARLTERGLSEAARLVRAHRLWELFLIRGVHVAPDHVDRDADSIEHLLTPEIVERLEKGWAVDLADANVPVSPHQMPTPSAPQPDREQPRD